MKKLFLVLASALILGGCSPKDLFVKSPSGLEIATSPAATVFLNGENKGETPYSDKNLKPGSYTLKLVPVADSTLPPYETKLTLISRVSTILSRTFAASDLDSSGYTLQLVEEGSGETYLSVISEPDTVSATIDDKPSGFTPLSKLPLAPGSHQLVVASPGYLGQELAVTTVKGYNLIVNFKLASQVITLTPPTPATPSASVAPLASAIPASSSATTMAKPYVLIGETGTGWLRVRQEDSGSSEELGKANTGEMLKYLGESTELGWHKVEFESQVGWVSGKYATIVK